MLRAKTGARGISMPEDEGKAPLGRSSPFDSSFIILLVIAEYSRRRGLARAGLQDKGGFL